MNSHRKRSKRPLSLLAENWHAILMCLTLAYLLIAKPLLIPQFAHEQENNFAFNHNEQTLWGIDVSHDQGNVDWQKVVASGPAFVYHKASDGMTYQDPMFDENISVLANLPVALGAYHFFEAEDDPIKQADNFLAQIASKPLTLSPMVDVEITRNQSAAQLRKHLTVFLQRIAQETGCKPLIYSYKDFWQNYIGPDFNAYPFWLADYSKTMEPPQDVAMLAIWQHSQTGRLPGIRNAVDLNLMLDGQATLEQLTCHFDSSKA